MPYPVDDFGHDGLFLLSRCLHVSQNEVLHRRDPVPVELQAGQILERVVNLLAAAPGIFSLLKLNT